MILADGFSCRTQIEQGDTGRTALHLAELLAGGLDTALRRQREHPSIEHDHDTAKERT